MKFEVSIPFQSQLIYDEGRIQTVGPRSLLLQVNQLKADHGVDVSTWPLQVASSADAMLINEFIHKAKGEVFVYNHDELCHCRMVPTEKVKNAVKAGCHRVADVSRTTLAGTGCGSCRKDIEDVIQALLKLAP